MKLARGGALTALTLLIAIGCGGSEVAAVPGAPTPVDDGDGGGVVDSVGPDGGGGDAGLPEAPPPPPGKPTKGVFVSASKGIEGADGTKDRPVKTLAAAIALAETKKPLPVIACAETFTEAVTLKDGVTMYGYFDCNDDWAPTDKRAKIVSPTSPAVLAENLVTPLRLEGFDIQAPDISGTAPAGTAAASSYGMIVKSSKNLALAQVSIRAGRGQDGSDGAEPAPNVERSPSAVGKPSTAHLQKSCSGGLVVICNFDDGARLSVIDGEVGGTSDCLVKPNGAPGGRGGGARITDNNNYRTTNTAAVHGLPAAANATQAQGGAFQGTIGSLGGQDAPAAAPGTTGQNGTASFTEAGFVPGNGTAGTNGPPGKGGGGGAGSSRYPYLGGNPAQPTEIVLAGTWRNATGAGGGAGGCGGIAGTPGSGGGASIGLFVVGSTDITLAKARIEASMGGRAGKGATGTAGLQGAPGGGRGAGESGAPGGRGGDGGAGGLSGHGSAGSSIALVFRGTRPTTADVQLVAGQPGDGHPAVTGAQTLPAVVGEAKQEHSF